MSYYYGYATEQDGEEISKLLENVDFKGEISLAYCRRPNAVLSIAKDGDKSTFAVAKDNEGKITGFGACIINDNIAYLTGFRVIKRSNIPKCYELLHKFCIDNSVKLTYTTILQDNVDVQNMLTKQRANISNMPNYLLHSELTTHIIKKNLHIKDSNKLTCEDNVYILKNLKGEELARSEVVEQWEHKQYIVKRYGWKLKIMKFFSVVFKAFKWMPNINEVLKFFTLKNVKAKDNTALESFLRHISYIPLQGSFFLFGGNYCPVKSLKYKSNVYIVDWNKELKDASNIKLNIEISDL